MNRLVTFLSMYISSKVWQQLKIIFEHQLQRVGGLGGFDSSKSNARPGPGRDQQYNTSGSHVFPEARNNVSQSQFPNTDNAI